LKLEAIQGDLLTLQRDLSLRAAALERLPVSDRSTVVGKQVSDMAWPPTVRLVTVFRGPFLIPPTDGFIFRADDIVIAIGLRADLDQIASWFAGARTGKA
jgi:Trk K+ transport system NAD-binding subunit